VGPCHRGMAHLPVADGGDGLQIWSVAADVLNKQSRTARKGWLPGLGLGEGLKLLTVKKVCYKMLQRASDLDGPFRLDSSGSG
jgi:hypothetical protein